MITPNNNIYQTGEYKRPIQRQNDTSDLFWNQESRINSFKTMEEWLKPLSSQYKMALLAYVSL